MPKTVTMYNRHGEPNVFTKTKEGWLWSMPSEYWRWGGTEEQIDFVDPSGGPFISRGDAYDGIGTIKEIKVHDDNTYLITTN